MSKKTKKGKTIPLTDFLATEPKLVTLRDSTWAAIVDEDEAQKKAIVVNMSGLPTAPRSAVDVDYSTLPNIPPFVAHVANLSFEIENEDLRKAFASLNPKSARIMRDGNRSRGVGLVEFETRENLIEALKRSDQELFGRKIRVNVSDKTDSHQTDHNRTNFSHRTGEERPEMSDRWQRVERKSDDFNDDRRERSFRNDQGRSNFTGGSRGSDYGFGYPRARDNDRQGPHNRHNDDGDHRQNSDMNRPRYSNRSNETRERNSTNDDNQESAKERPRLHLQPRTKPLEDIQPVPGSSPSTNNITTTSNTEESSSIHENSSNHPDDTSDVGSSVGKALGTPVITPSRGAGASIFGGAKPVDTTARELEIEKKLKELQMVNSETGDDQNETSPSSRPSYNRGQERDSYHHKPSSYNDEHHTRDRRNTDRSGHGSDYQHKREYSGGRRYEDDSRGTYNNDNHRRDYNSSRRDHEGGRTGKYNHHAPSDRDHYGTRDRDERTTNYQNPRRLSDETQSKPRTILRRTLPNEDHSNKLQLSNKFGMLDADDQEGVPQNDDRTVQSPPTDE